MSIQHRVLNLVVEWLNPRTFRWEPITSFGSEAAAEAAASWWNNQEFMGWESVKLSKSR